MVQVEPSLPIGSYIMQIKRKNRKTGERVFLLFRNSRTATLEVLVIPQKQYAKFLKLLMSTRGKYITRLYLKDAGLIELLVVKKILDKGLHNMDHATLAKETTSRIEFWAIVNSVLNVLAAPALKARQENYKPIDLAKIFREGRASLLAQSVH